MGKSCPAKTAEKEIVQGEPWRKKLSKWFLLYVITLNFDVKIILAHAIAHQKNSWTPLR